MIESIQNSFIKNINALKIKKHRDEQGRFVIEGIKFVNEISLNWTVEHYILSESFVKSKYCEIYKKSADPVLVTDKVFSRISNEENPQGILAVVKKRKWNLGDLLGPSPQFIVIAEKLQDPGNIGTLIRTTHAMGGQAVIISAGSADIYNPKTIRATAGSFFHIPVLSEADLFHIIPDLKQAGIRIIASHTGESKLPYETDFTIGFGLLIGNEGAGLSEEILKNADACVKIPMPGGTESLNAGVASGILMYEAMRQRSCLALKENVERECM